MPLLVRLAIIAGMFCLQQALFTQAAASRLDAPLIDQGEVLARDSSTSSLRINTKHLMTKLQSETAKFRALVLEVAGTQTPMLRRAQDPSSNSCSSAFFRVRQLLEKDTSCQSLGAMFADMSGSTTGSETSFDPSMAAKLCSSSCFASVKATFAAALQNATAADKATPDCVTLAAMMPMYDLMCLKEDGEYCLSHMQTLQDFDSDITTLKPSEVTETDLRGVCHPCIKKLMIASLAAVNAGETEFGDPGTIIERSLSMMCRKLNGKYCVLEMKSLVDKASESTDISLENNIEAICSPCGRATIAGIRQMQTPGSAPQFPVTSEIISAGCGKHNGDRCATLWETPDAVSKLNTMTQACRDVHIATTCPVGCAAAINAAIASVGCCAGAYGTTQLIESNPSANPGQVMAHITSICNTTSLPLSQAFTPACVATTSKTLKAAFPNVKYAAISANSTLRAQVRGAFQSDVATALGVAPEAIEDVELSSATNGGLSVSFVLRAETDEATAQVATVYEQSNGLIALDAMGRVVPASAYVDTSAGMELEVNGNSALRTPISLALVAAVVAAAWQVATA